MMSRLLVIILLLLGPVFAQETVLSDSALERQTHEVLFRHFSPHALEADVCRQAWDELSTEASHHEIWKRLGWLAEASATECELFFQNLAVDDPAVALYLRQLYLGWLYGGERGRRLAGLAGPPESRQPAVKPSLPGVPVSREEHEVLWNGHPVDYLIVGSGPAGSVLAYELSRAGHSVILLEKGSFVLPGYVDTRLPAELKVGGGSVLTQEASVIVRNGKAVGGGSAVNVDLAFAPTLPFVRARFRAWREGGLIDRDQWTESQVAVAYEWVRQTIGTRTPTPAEINRNNQILWDGAKLAGLEPSLYDLNTWPNRPSYADKKSSVNRLLLTAMTRSGSTLAVLPDLEVERIRVRGDKALGVSVVSRTPWDHSAVLRDPYKLDFEVGERAFVPAKRVLVCAGAQGSAELLLRSGVGGARVGVGLVLHPSVPLIGLFNDEIRATEGTTSSVYVVDPAEAKGTIYECMSADPNYVAFMLFGTADEIYQRVLNFSHLGGFGVMLVDQVSSQNRLVLNSAGRAEVTYSLLEADRVRLARAVSRAAEMMLLAGAKEVYIPSQERSVRHPDQSDRLWSITSLEQAESLKSKLRFRPGQTIITSAHMQGTCKMGLQPDTSVVGPDHRVWGVQNLYICDSSVFPTSVGANPMQSIYTVAKILADQLNGENMGL
jgi:choline dehydrogenase-like flavoprotein